ncbi:MAG: hypothetical protein OXT65_04085, partial [Alphaproteobacteria bacterium]|nr:hypothetical protein [Alphaproteobacteria bacterium]
MAPLAKKVLDTIERYRPSMRNEDAFKAERSQPSVLFEEKYGFTGLSQQHNLPEGLTFKDLDIYVRVLETAKERGDITHEEFITNLAEITENLEILNPALAALNPDKDNPDKMIAFITGTGSAFSLRDLAFFLSQPTGGKDVHDDPERKAVLGRLERKLSSPGWIPAPETLQDIERQLGKKLQDPDYALPPLGNPTDTEEWVAEQIRTQTNYYFKHLPVK